MSRSPIGLYLHIPFCRERKCPYCDFYSLPYDSDLADRYAAALLRAMELQPFGPLGVDTVYFGGGTPLLLGERLVTLLEGIRNRFDLAPGAEITLEANPGEIDPGLLRALRQAGVGRISFGVQSLMEEELAALGRRHSPRQGVEAVEEAAKAGFSRISADLMLGIPRQTPESLRQSVKGLASLPLDHISAYLLKIEENTPFAKVRLPALPDEDGAAGLYLEAAELLERQSFAQYEVSNFSKSGGESRHNLKYWLGEEYLGLGPAAHSFIGGQRFSFPPDLEQFLTADQPFDLREEQGGGGDAEEYAMLRLRLREGLDLGQWAARYPDADTESVLRRAGELVPRGLLTVENGVIRLTPQGFLLLSPVTGHLLLA